MKKILLTAATLALSCASMFADEYTATMPKVTENGKFTMSEVTWDLQSNSSFFGNVDGTKGMQLGSSGSPASSITLSTSGIEGTIVSVTVNTSGASGTKATVSVKVDNVDFEKEGETVVALTKDATDYTFTGSAEGTIEISWTQNTTVSSKAIYVKSITVEYGNVVVKKDAEIAWSTPSYTAEIDSEYTFPTLANPNNLAVTYSSSKEDVATINEAGVIEVLAIGTTEISAVFDGNDEYKAATAKFTLTVTPVLLPEGDTLLASMFKATTTNYVDFSGVKGNKSDAVYAGNNAYNEGNIQLRSDKDNAGIVSTTSGGCIRKVSVKWSNENNRVLNVYGSNTAYTAATDLYNDNKGELIGTLTATAGEPTTLTINGNYEYVGVRSDKGAIYLEYINFVWGEPIVTTVETPTFSLAAGEVAYGAELTISCETEDAEIYYTLDGTEPNKVDGILYDEPINLWDSVTVKAIAYVGESSSFVATAEYTVVVEAEDLNGLTDLEKNDVFKYKGELTVVYVNGSSNYVFDGNSYGLIYKSGLNLKVGNVIEGGWAGKVNIFNGLTELVPTTDLTVSETEGTVPEPMTIDKDNLYNIAAYNMNRYVKIEKVEFAEATPAADAGKDAKNFTGKVGEDTINFYQNFGVESVEAGVYNVTGFIAVYEKDGETTVQVYPIAFEKYDDSTAIETINAANAEDAYYTVSGVKVNNVVPGLYIRVNNGKATKVIVK